MHQHQKRKALPVALALVACLGLQAFGQDEDAKVITGKVLKSDGTPLAGAVIHATPAKFSDGGATFQDIGVPVERDLKSVASDFIKKVRDERASRKQAVSDDDGKYSIEVEGGSYALKAFAKGYTLTALDGEAQRAEAGSVVDFEGTAVAAVCLNVTLGNGIPERPVSVYWETDEYSRNLYWWDTNHKCVALTPGKGKLFAMYGPDNEYKSNTVDLDLEANPPTDVVSLELKPRGGVLGKVVFPAGARNWGGKAYIAKLGEDEDTPSIEVLTKAAERDQMHTESDYINAMNGNRFYYYDLEPGKYFVAYGIMVPIRALDDIAASQVIEVADGLQKVTLSVDEGKLGTKADLVVEGPDGEPLSDLSIRAEMKWSGQTASVPYKQIRVNPFTWRLYLQKPYIAYRGSSAGAMANMNLRAANYTFTLRSQAYGEKKITWNPANDSEIQVKFDKPASLAVTVEDYTGSALEGLVRVALQLDGAGNKRNVILQQQGRNTPDANGVVTISPLSPGDYKVLVQVKGDFHRYSTYDTVDTTVASGENQVSVSLPEVFKIAMDAGKLSDGTSFSLRPVVYKAQGFSQQRRVKDGRVEFNNVPKGDYYIWGPGGKMQVTVDNDAEITFEPTR